MSSRDKLIEAAITLFSERGYEGTSITDLVEETGANASLVSYHFGGKRGLLEAALHKLAHDKLVHAKSLLGKCKTEADFRVRLENFLEELSLFFVEQAPLIKLFFNELEQGSDGAEKEFEVAYSDMLKDFENFLKEAQRKKLLRKTSDVRILLVQILGPLSSLARSRNTIQKYLGVSLETTSFRKALIGSLVESVLAEKN